MEKVDTHFGKKTLDSGCPPVHKALLTTFITLMDAPIIDMICCKRNKKAQFVNFHGKTHKRIDDSR